MVKGIVDAQCNSVEEVIEMQNRLLRRKSTPIIRVEIDASRQKFALQVLCESERHAQDVRALLSEVTDL